MSFAEPENHVRIYDGVGPLFVPMYATVDDVPYHLDVVGMTCARDELTSVTLRVPRSDLDIQALGGGCFLASIFGNPVSTPVGFCAEDDEKLSWVHVTIYPTTIEFIRLAD